MPRSILASLRQMVADCGWVATVLYAVDRALRRLHCGRLYFYRLEVQPVPATPILPPHRGKQFEVRRLDKDEPAIEKIPRPKHVVRMRFDQGSIGFGGFRDSELVGMIWLHLGPYPEDEVRCWFVPGDKCSWDFDVYVRPDMRNSFLFARLWDAAFAYLRERGVTHSACRVSAWNAASIQSHRRLGARRLYSAVFLVLGSLQFIATSRAPYLHASFRPRRIPSLAVG
jgi:GNAT superfamily N-acetyltransferase